MAKNNVNIKLEADPKPAKTGIDKVTESLNKFAKQNKQLLNPLTKLNGAVQLLSKSFGIVTSVLKTASQAIKENVSLAQTQIIAEKQLEAAAQNNPYLNRDSVRQLEEYASELQKVSNVGDEQLIPMMAQLASAGRIRKK